MTDQVDIKIKDRESWLKTIVIGLFAVLAAVVVAVLAYRLATVPFQIDLTNFDFSDLLALILAIFAISMSAAFYFQTSRTSNTFYDNSYQFTRDISEILGRIEERFGERLRHLDEGYSGLQESIDKIDLPKIDARIKDEEEDVQKKQKEQDELLNDVLQKAGFVEKEKQDILMQLKQTGMELNQAKTELAELKEYKERSMTVSKLSPRLARFLDAVQGDILRSFKRRDVRDLRELKPGAIASRFNDLMGEIPISTVEANVLEMEALGILDESGHLSVEGLELLLGSIPDPKHDRMF